MNSIEHVVALLSNWRGKVSGDRFMAEIVQDASCFTSVEARTKDLIKCVDRYPLPSLEQQARVIEAYVVYHYRDALAIQKCLAELPVKNYEWIAYPLGLLKAAVWADQAKQGNRAFRQEFPTLFAEMIAAYARATQGGREGFSREDAQQLLRNLFAQALTSYLGATGVGHESEKESLRRRKSVLRTLDLHDFSALKLGDARIVIGLVTEKAFATLSLNERVEILLGRPDTRNTNNRLRAWAVANYISFRPHCYSLSNTDVVFASMDDGERYLSFYRPMLAKLAAEEEAEGSGTNIMRFALKHLSLKSVPEIPLPYESRDYPRYVKTELSVEEQEELQELAKAIFDAFDVPPEERHLPKAGIRQGAITFEWIPPAGWPY